MTSPILLYVSFNYPYGGGSGSHRTARLARHLCAAGWDVLVLSGPPTVEGTDPPADPFRLLSVQGGFDRGTPAGAAGRPGARHTPRPGRPSRLRVWLRQAAFIPDSHVYWIPSALQAARQALEGRSPAAILCSGPPFSTFLLGRRLAKAWKRPLILDYRDVWLDHPWWPVPRWRKAIESWMERRLLAAADLILVNHEAMRDAFLARNPWIAERTLVVPNGFDRAELGPPVRPAWRRGERFEIVYAGTLYRPVAGRGGAADALSVQRPVGLFRALRQLSERGAFGPGGVRVTFVGAKPSTDETGNLRACARECDVDGLVEVLPRLEKSQVVPILRRAHLLLNILYYTEAQVAQKVYDYLHLEIPILSLFRDSRANASIVSRARAGPVVDPADSPAISRALMEVLREYEAGRHPVSVDRDYVDGFDTRIQARLLDSRLRDLVAGVGDRQEGGDDA